MSELEILIVQKYQLEQKIKSIQETRRSLASKCIFDYRNQEIESYIKAYHINFNYQPFECCASFFYKILPHVNKSEGWENQFSYEQLLHDDGCEFCQTSYKLRKEDLTQARKALGIIKAKITRTAKKLTNSV